MLADHGDDGFLPHSRIVAQCALVLGEQAQESGARLPPRWPPKRHEAVEGRLQGAIGLAQCVPL